MSQLAQRNAGAGSLIAPIFLFGLLVSSLMVARSQVAGDQLNLLALGWLLAVEGHWVPLGNPASGGGLHPGGLLAVLTVVLAAGRLLEGPRSRWVWRAASLYTAVVVVLGPALALGAPPYRCGEPRCDAKSFRAPALRSDHPMFHQLGIHRTCPLVVDDPDGWWLDPLPERGAAGP